MNYDKNKCNEQLEYCSLDDDKGTSNTAKKALEIYTFIDPICPECWAFEPTLKKLVLEYGHYFKIRFIVAGNLSAWNVCQAKLKGLPSVKNLAEVWEKTASRTGMSCDGDLWYEDPIYSPYLTSIAIKAAEMQGKALGLKFLRKIRETLFLSKKNISKEDVLIHCAQEVGLDVTEFKHDLQSQGTIKALQCDMKTTKEMMIDHVPTFVFFNDKIEEEGLKVAGFYSYAVYEKIISELLDFTPERAPLPPLEIFLKKFDFVATKEVAVVYDITIEEAERRLKRLMLMQKVERVPVKYGTFWRLI